MSAKACNAAALASIVSNGTEPCITARALASMASVAEDTPSECWRVPLGIAVLPLVCRKFVPLEGLTGVFIVDATPLPLEALDSDLLSYSPPNVILGLKGEELVWACIPLVKTSTPI